VRRSFTFLSLSLSPNDKGIGSTAVELELLEEGQAAGKLIFKISKSPGGGANVEIPPTLTTSPDQVSPASTHEA
jgi:hypothetical protein